MITIKGKMEDIERDKIVPPNDGVHVAGKDGFIKGVRNILINGKECPRGMVKFYYRLSDNQGIQVYYSTKHGYATKLKIVERTFKVMRKLWDLELCPIPCVVEDVKLKLGYNGKTIRERCYGIRMSHVNYPEKAWADYARGRPYDWMAVEHPNHTPQTFLRFVESAKTILREHRIKLDTSFKLGDVLYDTLIDQWMIVDLDLEP